MFTIRAAIALNTLWRFFFYGEEQTGVFKVTSDEARAAVKHLVSKASKTGCCPWSEEKIDRLWPKKETK